MQFGGLNSSRVLLMIAAAFIFASYTKPVHAVPAFARQTNLECTTCHVSWPELTPTGRQFKLNGYTLGDRQSIPLAAMLQLSRTSIGKINSGDAENFPKNNDAVIQQISVFAAGKISDHVGAFSQWTYDGVDHRASIDNLDLRYANRLDMDGQPLVYGLTLHNNPTVQDIYNTGPAWGYPYGSSSVALTPNASSAIESLGQQVAGTGAYALWNNTLYGEFTSYRTANQAFSFLRAGTDRSADAALKGNNPYLRLALQHESENGEQSGMIGLTGFTVDRYPDSSNATGPVDRFSDTGIDAQYQYITDAHRYSMQFNSIRERQNWMATPQSNPVDRLRETRAKIGYYYQARYGLNLAYFSISGNPDNVLYNTGAPVTGSRTGSPDSRGYIWELNYLPKRDVRLMLQYTTYTRFNGEKINYDGAGRNARDNNTLYLLAWLMF
jgi:hypothetical protein